MMVSSISTITRSLVSLEVAISGAWAASRVKNLEATASSCRTWPKLNDRRNEPQRRGRVCVGKHPAHPTVAQQPHVIDAVCAGDHPGDERGDLQPGVRALVGRDAQMRLSQFVELRGPGQREDRDQPADDTRLGSSNTAEVARGVWQSCIYEVPFVVVEIVP